MKQPFEINIKTKGVRKYVAELRLIRLVIYIQNCLKLTDKQRQEIQDILDNKPHRTETTEDPDGTVRTKDRDEDTALKFATSKLNKS